MSARRSTTLRYQILYRPLLCLVLLAGAGGCSPGSRQEDGNLQGKLTLTGSSTIAPLVSEIGKRFESQHSETRVDVQTGGSSRGIADVQRGTADIGMASRALKPEESSLTPYTIAVDGIGLILNSENPVESLDKRQVVAIYRGEITNWADVGGVDAPVTVVNKAEGRSTLELFLAYFDLENSDIQAHIVIGDNQQGIQTVAHDPHAIGYVSIGTAAYETARGTAIKLLPMGGIAATRGNVRDATFPLARPLNLVIAGTPSPLAMAFIDYARSAAVDDLIEAQYFVPTTP